MPEIRILLINNGSREHPLENLLDKLQFTWTGLAASELNKRKITEEIRPEIIFLLTTRIDHLIVQIIRDINQNYPRPTILFTDDLNAFLDEVIEAGVSSILAGEKVYSQLDGIIAVANARFNYLQCLKSELANTKLKLAERKVIDRAKGILIQSQNCSENEAYHLLRKLAMERSLSMAEMAKNVIAMAELLHE